MSRYLVNKFIYQVDADPDLLAAYVEDPVNFVTWWENERATRLTEVERVTVHSFTDHEREAVATMDIRSLYVMGAHPFILWTLFFPILEQRLGTPRAAIDEFRRIVAEDGNPDFAT